MTGKHLQFPALEASFGPSADVARKQAAGEVLRTAFNCTETPPALWADDLLAALDDVARIKTPG